ncbi:MAG: DUF1028 domain-containing protein [Balneolaceae bacterium]|nr:DUF1028 domain-containing protein [Balneolaceae bacterium]
MKRILTAALLIVATASANLAYAQKSFHGDPLAHTFSIVARDSVTGDIGVAVQSHWFSVGQVVSWAEAGVGAVATQSLVNTSFGPRGLELLRAGLSPQEAIEELIESDEGRDFRQVAIIDSQGRVAAYTGKKCIAEAGHRTGTDFSVQANMMLNDTVWPAMAEAFNTSEGPLAERMVAALQAAQSKGGDIRGQQSASILVVRGEKTGKPWEDRTLDLRVEDHPKAVDEITRLLKVHRAYEHMNRGDMAIEHGNVDRALEEYGAAQKMFPGNVEMKYWTAVSLANVGKLERALPLFREVFEEDKNWVELTRRIVPNGILQVDNKMLDRILTVHK